MTDNLRKNALEYHRSFPPGKLQVTATKALATQRDLALAYSPGVAAACEAIVVCAPLMGATATIRGRLHHSETLRSPSHRGSGASRSQSGHG